MFSNSKFNKLFNLMADEKMDAIMIGPSSDMAYINGYHAHLDERLNILVLLRDGRYFHISPLLNYEEAKRCYPEDAHFYPWSDGEGYLDTVQKAFQDYDLLNKNIGVNEAIRAIDLVDFMSVMPVKFKNAHGLMESFRILKSEDEIKYLKEAGAIADEIMLAIKGFIKPGLYEQDVIDEIIRLYKSKGLSVSFDPIVATGKNSSMPHYNAGTTKIQLGDNVVVDCGCVYHNVCSDTSRTFFVGEPSQEQREIYRICKEATFTAQNHAKAGMCAGELDKYARDIIDQYGYGHCFLNRTGHGIGFSVHEAPYIKANNPLILENGMAFSIEPGIYIAGKFGMRVENILVIENDHAVSVNHSPVDIEEMIIHI